MQPEPPIPNADARPMTDVSWLQASQFCNRLSVHQGVPPCYQIDDNKNVQWEHGAAGYRLPTEAEWEYACRAGTRSRFFFGDEERLWQHPEVGDVIPGTGGARKVRFAGRGRGKSGGFRVITFYSGPDVPVFLLNIFAKGDKINLTHAERNALRAILANIVTAYRQGARHHDEGRQ